MTIFQFLDYLTTNLLLPLGGILIAIFVGWFISKETINEDNLISSRLLKFIWSLSVKFIAPMAVFFIMLNAIGINIVDI